MPYFGIPIRNGLPIGLGSVAGFGIAPFEPYSLFENGEQGAWYDPSDFSTLFEDSAGTTPVTAVEQFVGLMLDKSGRGNHATQTTSAKRPKLAARYNLLTYSEEFDNGAWTKFQSTVTSNAAVAPNGTTTADKLIPNNGATSGFTYNTASPAIPVGTGATASVWVKAAELGFAWVVCNVRASSLTTGVCVNLSTGALTNGGANGTYAVTNAGNGWWRVECTATASSASSYIEVWPLAAAGTPSTYTGDGTSGIYIWGADLRPADQATGLIGPTYQRVAAATVYDTAGFLPYLAFDGLSWSMSTNSIDFSATDKVTVWAGVRKLSDPALGIITELGPVVDSNNGSFAVGASIAAAQRYVSALNGTGLAYYEPAIYAAPITNVLATSFNIAGAAISNEISPRVNGILEQDNPSGANAGTGNFGNYPLNIGARNNASNFFNGWMYSLTVRGAQSSASEISAMESWVAGKTGVSI
jgi:hypothetical protein